MQVPRSAVILQNKIYLAHNEHSCAVQASKREGKGETNNARNKKRKVVCIPGSIKASKISGRRMRAGALARSCRAAGTLIDFHFHTQWVIRLAAPRSSHALSSLRSRITAPYSAGTSGRLKIKKKNRYPNWPGFPPPPPPSSSPPLRLSRFGRLAPVIGRLIASRRARDRSDDETGSAR